MYIFRKSILDLIEGFFEFPFLSIIVLISFLSTCTEGKCVLYFLFISALFVYCPQRQQNQVYVTKFVWKKPLSSFNDRQQLKRPI